MRGRKMVGFILLVLLSVLSASTALEASAQKVVLQINSYVAYVDDVTIMLDTVPFVHEGRTMVPLKVITDAFEYETRWDASSKKVSIIGEDIVIELIIGQSVAVVNGELFFIDGASMISEGKTMVPIRFISEVMGYRVDWNQTTKIITIRVPPAPVTSGQTQTPITKTEEITGVINIDLNEILANQEITYEINYESTVGSKEGLHVNLYRENVTAGTYSMSLSNLEIVGNINPEYEEWLNAEYAQKINDLAREFVVNNSKSISSKNKLMINTTVHTNGKMVSIMIESYESADPRNIKIDTRTFDVEAGAELTLQDLFLDGIDGETMILRELNRSVAQLVLIQPSIGIFTIETLEHFFVDEDKIIFFYEPYKLSPNYAGIMQYNVMYSNFKSYLKPEYFGEYVILPTMEEKFRIQREAEEAERLKNQVVNEISQPAANADKNDASDNPYGYIPQENDYEDERSVR